MQLKVNSEGELATVARDIIDFAGDEKIWLFYGEMGAGKTTLIKAICDKFGVEDNVNSPSFTIVNEYENTNGEKFYHFDFYRIKNEEEVLDIGIEEYFYSNNICLIEWPIKISSLIPEKFLKIEIEILTENSRLINLFKHGQ